MNRRIGIEIALGALLAAGFFYWLYLRPEGRHEILMPEAPELKQSLAENRNQVLLIGVEGLTWPVVLELINQDRLPNLARLLGHGTHGLLSADPPLVRPALWTTIVTGQPPPVHGLDRGSIKLPDSYQEVRMTGRFRHVPALWDLAAGAGRKVGVVNWAAASPVEKIPNGVFIAEGVNPAAADDRTVWPAAWREKVKTAPSPRFLPYEEELSRVKDPRADQAYAFDRTMFAIALEVMREKQPDLMLVYFPGLDLVTRSFYKYRWPAGLDYFQPVSGADRRRYEKVIEMHYQFLDRLIGGLLSEAEGYTVLVVSASGLGPATAPNNIYLDLNHLLERLDYLSYEGPGVGPTCDLILSGLVKSGELEVPAPRAGNIFGMCQQLERETKTWLQRGEPRMAPAAVDGYLAAHLKFKGPDTEAEEQKRVAVMSALADLLLPDHQRQDVVWSRTSVFGLHDSGVKARGLYLNVKGREPQGVIAPEDYSSFRGKVVKDLARLRTDDGVPLFTRVSANPRKELYPLSKDDPPDILCEVNPKVLWRDFVYRSSADPDPIPLPAVRFSFGDISAEPVPEGVFIMSGEQVQTFRRLDVNALDLAPTLLWLMGLPVADDLPGRVRREAFDDPFNLREPLYIKSFPGSLPAPTPALPGKTPVSR